MNRFHLLAALATSLVASAGCALDAFQHRSAAAMPVESRPFGTTEDGRPATLYTLTNSAGVIARVTDFGATLVEMHVPDRDGALADVVLGFDDVAGYESDANQYFGCTTGRVCNRIALGRFTLDGRDYTLARNNPPNHLHGGERGFGQRMFEPGAGDGATMTFTYRSRDGEEGYPGSLTTRVRYTLTEANELIIEYEAWTDAKTPVNLTNHAYWNLGGAGSGSILDHELRIDAKRFTPCDETLIPTGVLASVIGTPLDFRTPKRIGDRIEQLTVTAAKGYDHNYVVDGIAGTLRDVCRLHDPASGRTLLISTTEPGLQFYSGNFLKGDAGKGGRTYEHRGALCLETQHFPDSVNQSQFPSTILGPDERFRSMTTHTFSVE